MRDVLFRTLHCPRCRGDLALEAFEEKDGDVIEGLLACGPCSALYPIVDAIPNFLPGALLSAPGFLQRHRVAIDRHGHAIDEREVRRFERLHRRTAGAFGFEWNRYAVTTPDEDRITLWALTGIDPVVYRRMRFADVFVHAPTRDEVESLDASFLRGKRVLEIGCGMGKYVRTVADAGAEAFGLDLSHSLERARRELGDRRNAHLVRGNILEPPFRAGAFDFVYSVGVLHHTPDCHQAFLRSSELVREDGHLAVWLYPTERQTTTYARLVHWVQDDLLRPITCRLPHPVLHRLCQGLGRLSQLRDEAVRRGHTGRARLYALVAVGSHPDPEIAAFLNFDWYGPQYRSYHSEDELLGWYRDAGYADVRILPQRTSGIGRRRHADEPPPDPPPPRVHANLEAPGDPVVTAGDPLLVGGWAFEEAGRSPIVRVHLAGRCRATLRCAEARLDVKNAFPEVAHALYAGFHARIRVPRRLRGRVPLRVTVELEGDHEPLWSAERELDVRPRPRGRDAERMLRWLLPQRAVRRLGRSLALRRLTGRPPRPDSTTIPGEQYQAWLAAGEPEPPAADRDVLARLSLVVRCDARDGGELRAQLASVAREACGVGDLLLVVDAPDADTAAGECALSVLVEGLPAARILRGIARGPWRDALAGCRGDFVALLDGAVLARDALARISRLLAEHPDLDLVYGDHDRIDPTGRRDAPRFTPGWSPERLLVDDHLGPLQVHRRSRLESLLASDEAGPDDLYDLALRASERQPSVARIPAVLAHQLASRAAPDERRRRRAGERAAATRALARRGVPALVAGDPTDPTAPGRLVFTRDRTPRVAIVIPTRDRLPLLERCVTSLVARTRYPAYEIVIVDDRSQEPATLAWLASCGHRVVRGPTRDRFDFSALVNLGARSTEAELLLLLNNDTEIVRADWLDEMVGHALLPGVGAVGAKLLYPDGRIQHAGVVLGHEGLTGHYFQAEEDDDPGYDHLKRITRNVAAVTGACLLTPRRRYLELGGFDEKNLSVAWNDVDYCLRLLATGERVVLAPHAVVVHHEGLSRGGDKDESEIRFLLSRWRPLVRDDPYYHPAFSRTGASYRLRLGGEAEHLFYRRWWRDEEPGPTTD